MMEFDFARFFTQKTDYPVCLTNGRPVSFVAIMTTVNLLHKELVAFPEQRFVLAAKDTLKFICGFLALILARKTIILPANIQPGTLQTTIKNPQAWICDFALDSGLKLLSIRDVDNTVSSQSVDDLPAVVSNGDDIKIELCTSGTTGEPTQISKPLQTFLAEVACLEAQWGQAVAGKCFVSTVSHQHIYGLLFRVLWPMLTRRQFVTDNIEYPEQIIRQAGEHAGLVLISSPAYLKRMADVLDPAELGERLGMIFSSGGPLQRDVALSYLRNTGIAPTEVLGSTETGGIAHRQQTTQQEEPWHKFPPVQLRKNLQSGALEIQSPFCFTPDWYAMGDRVEIITDSEFRLLGRLDRIIKLEEKRISLDQMERVLSQCSFIEQARIIDLPGHRTFLGVVAILTEEGQQCLERIGRKDFAGQLKQHLSDYFERVTLPRKWRYVDDFPYNSQGKVTRQAMLALFDGDE